MGGASSQPVDADEPSGIFSLSDEMQAQLAQDFHNDQIVKLFGKQLEKIGQRKAAILQDRLEQRSQLQHHMEQFRSNNNHVQEQLDQAMEALEDKFADSANILEYDMERLTKRYLGGRSVDASSANRIPCLTERSDIATCYQHHKSDPGACGSFIRELVNCTEKTITSTE